MPHNKYGTYLQQLPQEVTQNIRQLEVNRREKIISMLKEGFSQMHI